MLQAGLYPFILGGVIKAALGAGIITLAWCAVGVSDKRKAAKSAE